MIDRRQFLTASGLMALAAVIPQARAEMAAGRVLFGYPPGAVGTDLGRGCVQLFNQYAKVKYAFEFVEGHNSRDASVMARNSAPDGLTLLQAQSTSMVLLPNAFKNLGYDPLTDFAPITALGELSFSLTLGSAVPASVNTLDRYLEWLAANPDQRDVGFGMHGSHGHLAMLMLRRVKSIAIAPRPYTGTLALLKDLLSGAIAAGFTTAGNGNADLWNSGKLRSIAITRSERLSYWPSVPTFAELGLPELDFTAWFAWFAPAAVPAALLKTMREDAARMKATPDFAALARQLFLQPLSMEPIQFRERISQETERYQRMAQYLKIQQLD
jgi:tripartite-type tricarboxylate transporter receptor subunit TctC